MDNKTIQKPDHSIDRMLQLAGLPIIKNSSNPTLLNEELQRMQTLAGLSPDKHKFEIFLEQRSHLTINEILFQLNEDWRKDQEEAVDYWDNLSDQEKNAAIELTKKLNPDDLNLTKDQFEEKVANISRNNKLVKTSLWKRIVIGALASILGGNATISPIATAMKNDDNGKKIELQAKQAQNKLNKLTTANFNDVGNIKQAEKINSSLDDPTDGDDALHIPYKTSGNAIKGQQRQDTEKFGDNIIDIVDDGFDVDVNATSTYSHQPDDPDNENKTVDGKQLDKARANSFKAVSKEDIKKAALKKGYSVSEKGDTLNIKTPKGVKTVKITSDIAKEVGKANKTGDVDQGTVVKTKVVQGPPEKVQAIWQSFVKDMGLPKMPKDNPDDVEKATEPTGKSDEKPTNRSDRKPTPRPTGDETPTGPAPAGEQESSQRNTQLGVLLKAINKNADAFTQLEVPYNTRLTQSIFNKAQSQQAKNLTALITAIRKNPDYFLSKVSKLTGTQLAQRDKVTNRFAKAPVAEGLLLENQIDDLLKQVGITDELIKQKGKAIVDYLTKIYKLSTSNTAATTQPEVPKDTQNVLKQIDSNAALKQSLVNINTVDELINILSSTMQYVDKGYAKNTSDIATAARDGARVTKDQPPANRSNINTTGGQTSVNYKVVEAEMPTPPDALKTVGLIGKYPSLLNMLKNINNRVELVPLWIGIISRVNPTLSQDGTSVNRVWQKLLTLVQKPPTQ